MGCLQSTHQIMPIPPHKQQDIASNQQRNQNDAVSHYMQSPQNRNDRASQNFIFEFKQSTTNPSVAKSPQVQMKQLNINENLNDQNLDAKIGGAIDCKNKQERIKKLNAIVEYIINKYTRQLKYMEKLAYVETKLALQYSTQSQKYQYHELRALKVYQQFQADFYQQIISILINSSLRDEDNSKTTEAIAKYIKIIQLCEKYLSLYDERRILTLNNLACAYSESKQDKQAGLQIYQQLLKQNQVGINKELYDLIKNNYEYYNK